MNPPKRSPPPTNRPPASPPPTNPQGERVQKVLAAAGLASRREIERWIAAGRVRIGDQVARLGDRAASGALIFLDDKPVKIESRKTRARLIAYHKPIGEMVTRSDPGGRPTVFDRLPKLDSGRWIAVGRLDYNTSGLLLLTDSGELANQLMHPRNEFEREYEVRVQGRLGPAVLEQLRRGVALDDGPASFKTIEAFGQSEGANHWYRVVLAEGRNREVRRMIEAVGGRVSRLRRVRFGPIALPANLPAGQSVELDPGAAGI